MPWRYGRWGPRWWKRSMWIRDSCETAKRRRSRGAFRSLQIGRLRVVDASSQFMNRLRGVSDPERKRAIIGQAFVDVQDRILSNGQYKGQNWMLGQGTIYPDTIESGGTHSSDVIKTHHNRVDRIQELLAQGRVLEPLSEFYKDEVRELGYALGLPRELLERHPFPGPGLAIRCLCTASAEGPASDSRVAALARRQGYSAFLLPVRSVGVQGDSRSYARLTVLHGDDLDFQRVLPLSTAITNEFRHTNRVVPVLGSQSDRACGLEDRVGDPDSRTGPPAPAGGPGRYGLLSRHRSLRSDLAVPGGAASLEPRTGANLSSSGQSHLWTA